MNHVTGTPEVLALEEVAASRGVSESQEEVFLCKRS